jgi:hypothetical protein
MAKDTFTRREVERAFRKFNDCVRDLFASVAQTWTDHFTHLMTHCELDPVMRVVTEPLRSNPNVNAEEWYEQAMASLAGVAGSGSYTLPTDDDDQTALLYQFFLMLERGEGSVFHFCMGMYGTTGAQAVVRVFNEQLVQKFTREVSYRLDEIREDLGDAQEVQRDRMLVFHYHDHSGQDHSMNVHGNIQGSNLAVGGSSVAGSSATYNNNADLAEALKALKPLIGEVAAEQRQAVESALDKMVEATMKNVPVAQVAEVKPAVEEVAKASPTLGTRLKEIGGKIGTSLASSAIFQAIKSCFGIH